MKLFDCLRDIRKGAGSTPGPNSGFVAYRLSQYLRLSLRAKALKLYVEGGSNVVQLGAAFVALQTQGRSRPQAINQLIEWQISNARQPTTRQQK